MSIEDDSIDLTNMDLLEFTWHGDFVIFASKFKNLSFATLTVLSMKSPHISIEDAVTLLHSCRDLEEARLGIIQHEDCEGLVLLKGSDVYRKALPKLARLSLESNVPLQPLMKRIRWTAQIDLSFTLRKQGKANIHNLITSEICSDLQLNCHLTPQELFDVQEAFPFVKYNDIGDDAV